MVEPEKLELGVLGAALARALGRIEALEADDYQIGFAEGKKRAWEDVRLPFDPLAVAADWEDNADIAFAVAQAAIAHLMARLTAAEA